MTTMPNVIAFRPLPVNQPLRRPRTLIRAARAGQSGWKRERDLARLLRSETCPRPGAALPRLRAEEARMNAARQEGAAEYDLHRHVTLMIAILAEMRAAVAEAPVPVILPNSGLPAVAAGIGSAALAGLRAAVSGLGTASPAHL